MQILSNMNVKYLSTRNLCQDPLELLFGKIRQIAKYPTPYEFCNAFGRISAASLISSPVTSNVEDDNTGSVDLLRMVRINCYPSL